MKIIVEINCNSSNWKENKFLPMEDAKKFTYSVIAQTLKSIGFSCKELIFSILFTNDKKIQKLNAEYRGKNSPTNVLSFPYIDEEILKNMENYHDEIINIGDIVLSYETILRESNEKSWPFDCSEKVFRDHYSHLIAHSVLHLFGYDHESDEDCKKMEEKEILILKELGIENPYESVE